jgi:hypothetical protein
MQVQQGMPVTEVLEEIKVMQVMEVMESKLLGQCNTNMDDY